MITTLITTNEQIALSLQRQGKSKKWLARQLGISRKTLYRRLEGNGNWLPAELKQMEKLKLL